jgi:hypothetical protein
VKQDSKDTVPKVLSTFLAGTEMGEMADARTNINTPELGLQLLLYRAIGHKLKSKFADYLATRIECLQVSFKGIRSEQVVEALKNIQTKPPRVIYEGHQEEPIQ